MQPVFRYKGRTYSYIIVDGEIIPYRIDKENFGKDFRFDEDMKKQLEVEFTEYETALNDSELRIWRGEE